MDVGSAALGGGMMPSHTFAGLSPDDLKNMALILYNSDGSQSWTYGMGQLDDFISAHLISAIHSSVRLAVAVVLAITLLLLARSYRSPLFIMYQINFLFMLLGSALELNWLFSFQASMTEYLTSGQVPASDRSVSVAASAFFTLLIMSLLASLVLQIYVACSDLKRSHQLGVTLVAALGCFPAYLTWIWRLALVGIHNMGSAKGLGPGAYGGTHSWVYQGAWRSFAASTAFCSIILCIKLWVVQRKRARLGVEKFDPIRVLLTMALQNSVVPAILVIVSIGFNANNLSGQSISAASIPISAALVPIGYIWAQYTLLRDNDNNDRPTAIMSRAETLARLRRGRKEPMSPTSEDGSVLEDIEKDTKY